MWRLYHTCHIISQGKRFTVATLKSQWLKQVDPVLPQICKVTLEQHWTDDMDDMTKFQICTNRLQLVKDLRKLNGLPDDILDDVERPDQDEDPNDRVLYPNMKPRKLSQGLGSASSTVVQSVSTASASSARLLPISSSTVESTPVATPANALMNDQSQHATPKRKRNETTNLISNPVVHSDILLHANIGLSVSICIQNIYFLLNLY